jgi:hypothetical protein
VRQHPKLDTKIAYELVEELEAVPHSRPAGSRAYFAMASRLIKLCHGNEKMSPFEQARVVIDIALDWDEWRGPAGLSAAYESRFAPYKPPPSEPSPGSGDSGSGSGGSVNTFSPVVPQAGLNFGAAGRERDRCRAQPEIQPDLFGDSPVGQESSTPLAHQRRK